jgi:hypothetical protein
LTSYNFEATGFNIAHFGACTGTEASYTDCEDPLVRATNCQHYEDMGVVCGEVSIADRVTGDLSID